MQAQQDVLPTAPFEKVARDAALKSTLAQPGAAPFHLRGVISDQAKHDPQWDAEVEIWWSSPTRYKRVFHCASFSQSLTVDGAKVQETDSGPVFPELLRNLTVELIDPIPRLDPLEALHLSAAVSGRHTGTDRDALHDPYKRRLWGLREHGCFRGCRP